MITFGIRFQPRGGRIWLSLFACVGLIAVYVAARQEWPNRRSGGWMPVQGTIVSSDVVRTGSELWLHCKVEYDQNGRSVLAESAADGLDQGPVRGSYYDLALARDTTYAPGNHVTVYADPHDPHRFVLGRNVVAWLRLPVFASIFVLVPATLFLASPRWLERIAPLFVGSVLAGFLLVGMILLAVVTVPEISRIVRSQGWQPVEARSIDAWVVTRRGKRSTSHRVAGIYEYRWEGRSYRSDRLKLGMSGAGGEVQAELARFAPGTIHQAYVNPADPREALLDRSLGFGNVLVLFPLFFVLLGGGPILLMVRHRRKLRKADPGRS